MKIAVFCLARPTFDVRLAQAHARTALDTLLQAGHDIVGDDTLLMDGEALALRLSEIGNADAMLIIQASFCDATMACRIAETNLPLAIWAFPEAREGGRLRLNSFCGLNLAQHALGKVQRPAGWHHAPPDIAPDFASVLEAATPPSVRTPDDPEPEKAMQALGELQGPIGLFGDHPDGFSTCAFDADALRDRFGAWVHPYGLEQLFDAARAIDPERVSGLRAEVGRQLADVETLDPDPLEKSLRVYAALSDFAAADGLAGMAVRCWPETFTEYGCAVCGSMARMSGEFVPASCEADMLGTVTSRLMQALAGTPTMLTDIVDIDTEDDTGVLWHCGLAPLDFCDPDYAPEATLHTNRMKPLLHQFPLKPGRITLARISQARGESAMVVGRGEVLKRPMAFTGTSGVVRFDCGAHRFRESVLNGALEHHVSIVYGDIRDGLISAAAATGLSLIDLDRLD